MHREFVLADAGPHARIWRNVTAVVLTAVCCRVDAAERIDPTVVTAMEKFLQGGSVAQQYSATRRLEASGSGQRGWLDVKTDFSTGAGMLYEVKAEGGSGYIRKRVLRSLLDEEQRIIALRRSSRVAISRDNYEFIPGGISVDGLAIVGLRPLRKDRALIVGRMFLTSDGDLVRVEGRLAKTPSFWVTRVNVVRTYRRINGVLMPVALETTAQLRFLGSSALRMTYAYSQIDEQPVLEDAVDRQ